MLNLGLTEWQITERRKGLGAGDATRIMAGEWNALWQEKMGFAAPVDLSGELRVQLGSFTEPFNLAWYMQTTGRDVEYFSGNRLMRTIWKSLTGKDANENELARSMEFDFIRCNIDALSTTSRGAHCVVDAKHVAKSDEAMIKRYTAAGTHQAFVVGVDHWALSVLVGNNKLEVIEQEVDPFFQEELIAKEREFWDYVERKEEPQDRIEEEPPKPQKVLRVVQLFDEFKADWPNWGGSMTDEFRVFRSTLEAANLHALTRNNIKGLLPDDVGEVLSPTVRVSRTKAGAITIAKAKEEC